MGMKIVWSLAVILFSGCDLLQPTDVELMASISNGMGIEITAPDTVRRGTRFNVSVRTYYCFAYAPSSVTVTVRELTATVTPYVRREARMDCAGILDSAIQSGWVRFSQPGTATVVVTGRVHGDTVHVVRRVHVSAR